MFSRIKILASVSIFMMAFGIMSWHLAFAEDPPGFTLDLDDDENPPGVEFEFDDDEGSTTTSGGNSSGSSSGNIDIVKASAFPVGFNPKVSSTKITYEVDEDAVIKIKILDSKGSTVVTLVDDEEADEDEEYSVKWYGTDTTTSAGDYVPSGTYTYKIYAKDPDDLDTEDTAEGVLNISYGGGDFETPVEEEDDDVIQDLHNDPPDTTSDTGPGVLIYLLAPVVGYVAGRKRS